jgi:HlyD family secretion protein
MPLQEVRGMGVTEPLQSDRGDAAQMPSPIAANPPPSRAAALIVAASVAAIVGLSLWYLAQPQPLLIQGEADATRIDVAARVDGRVGQRPVSRGDNVAAGSC